jgi:hypothetical protein
MNRLLPYLLAVSLCLLSFVAWQVETISVNLTSLSRIEIIMQTATTTWTSGTTTHTVSTPRGDSESATAWAARHKEGVDAMQALFPPNEE